MIKIPSWRKVSAGFAVVALAVTSLASTPSMAAEDTATKYLVGAGMYDVTGAVVETGAFGYASGQEMTGLHQRLYAHAFIAGDLKTGKRVAMVSVDAGALFPNIRFGVLDKLKATYGNTYNSGNVMISATHSHVANSGMAVEQLYRIAGTDKAGFNYDQRIVDTMIDGIYKAIVRANDNLQEGTITYQEGKLPGVTRNRSAEAYKHNLNIDKYDSNVITEMKQLTFKASNGKPLGVYNWFPTHPTSFPMNWTLISADSKGYAQYRFEKDMGSDPSDPKAFVAAFANSAEGDVVPANGNTASSEGWGSPEGKTDYNNAEDHGSAQYEKAKELFNSTGTPITGPIDSRTHYAKMPGYKVSGKYTNGDGDRELCVAARGFSFAPGGENGPSGIAGVHEGMTVDNFEILVKNSAEGTLVRLIGAMIGFGDDPCQAEKKILIADGKLGWTPTSLPFQIIRIGSLAVIAAPVEATTMSGRVLMEDVEGILKKDGVKASVVNGLSNAYAGYLATREEFKQQHYEGASTEFGPYQLAAFKQEYAKLANALVDGSEVEIGDLPKLPNAKLFAQRPGVVYDGKPWNEKFGKTLKEPNYSYKRGEIATAEFRGGHPKNDYRTMNSYLRVQRKVNGQWVDYLDDHDWDTSFHWKRERSSWSRATVEWRIGENTPAGTYRLVQTGDWKNGWNGRVNSYVGYSRAFNVR